jgi:hypothetical protein
LRGVDKNGRGEGDNYSKRGIEIKEGVNLKMGMRSE